MDEIRILLVDDEVEFVSTLAERLALRGFIPRTANDGEEALREVAAEIPQMVILDLMMPGLSGLETLKQIKAVDAHIPVILLTGHGSTREGIEGMLLGAFDFLMKPLDIDGLIEKIREAVKEHGAGYPNGTV